VRITEKLLALDDRDDLSPEQEALAEVLMLLIEDYEEKNYPLPQVSPNDSLNTLMEERGLKHGDIWPVLGNKGASPIEFAADNPSEWVPPLKC